MGIGRHRTGHGRTPRLVAATLLASTMIVVTSGPPASAATLTVTTTLDVSAPGDGVLSLREAVTEANRVAGPDTIRLAAGGSYTLTDCSAGALSYRDPAVLTIEGNGASIQQMCEAQQLLTIPLSGVAFGARFELRSLRLLGGPNTAGARVEGMAVHGGAQGQVGLTDVEITGFDASVSGSVIFAAGGHGTSPYHVSILRTDIHDNRGTAIAGDHAATSIDSSRIRSNTSGVVVADAWPAVVRASEIVDNAGRGFSSSGVGLTAHTFQVLDSTISRNGSVGMHCRQCGSVTIARSTFEGNGRSKTEPQRLGGVSLDIGRPSTTTPNSVTITDTVVSGNAANVSDRGGGLTVQAGVWESATAPGVATTITGSTFTGNSTTGSGGGIRLTAGSAIVRTTTISDNTAGLDGGGFSTSPPTGRFNVNLDGVNVLRNTAARRGGGVAVTGTNSVVVTASTVSSNRATQLGGGLFAQTTAGTTIRTSRFGGNSSADGGGAHLSAGGLQIQRSTFDGNSARGIGGGALVATDDISMVGQSTFSGNSAGKGGALAHLRGRIDVRHVTSTANNAVEGSDIWQPAAFGTVVVASALVSPRPCLIVAAASVSGSVFADGSCGSDPTSTVTTTPGLGPLADNGGPTPTHLPLAGSPLLARIPAAACVGTTDQRGTARPQGAACEAGSVEVA